MSQIGNDENDVFDDLDPLALNAASRGGPARRGSAQRGRRSVIVDDEYGDDGFPVADDADDGFGEPVGRRGARPGKVSGSAGGGAGGHSRGLSRGRRAADPDEETPSRGGKAPRGRRGRGESGEALFSTRGDEFQAGAGLPDRRRERSAPAGEPTRDPAPTTRTITWLAVFAAVLWVVAVLSFSSGFYELPVWPLGALFGAAAQLPPQILLMVAAAALGPLGLIFLFAATAKRAVSLTFEARRLQAVAHSVGSGPRPAAESFGDPASLRTEAEAASRALSALEASFEAAEERAQLARDRLEGERAALSRLVGELDQEAERCSEIVTVLSDTFRESTDNRAGAQALAKLIAAELETGLPAQAVTPAVAQSAASAPNPALSAGPSAAFGASANARGAEPTRDARRPVAASGVAAGLAGDAGLVAAPEFSGSAGLGDAGRAGGFEPKFDDKFQDEDDPAYAAGAFDDDYDDEARFDDDDGETDGYDGEGYDAEGYDAEGYDAEGYDSEGYTADGYDGRDYDDKAYADDKSYPDDKSYADDGRDAPAAGGFGANDRDADLDGGRAGGLDDPLDDDRDPFAPSRGRDAGDDAFNDDYEDQFDGDEPFGPAPAAAVASRENGRADAAGDALTGLDWGKLVIAANFPDSEEDRETLDAIYAVLNDRQAAALLQSAEDALSALADIGLFMEDMKPNHGPVELWRAFIIHEDRRDAIDLGGVRDPHAIQDVMSALRDKPDFTATAERFMERYESMLGRLFDEAPSANMAVELADTRSGRAYMLIGRASGRFG